MIRTHYEVSMANDGEDRKCDVEFWQSVRMSVFDRFKFASKIVEMFSKNDAAVRTFFKKLLLFSLVTTN